MRLLLRNSETGQKINDRFGLHFQFAGQLVDSDLVRVAHALRSLLGPCYSGFASSARAAPLPFFSAGTSACASSAGAIFSPATASAPAEASSGACAPSAVSAEPAEGAQAPEEASAGAEAVAGEKMAPAEDAQAEVPAEKNGSGAARAEEAKPE